MLHFKWALEFEESTHPRLHCSYQPHGDTIIEFLDLLDPSLSFNENYLLITIWFTSLSWAFFYTIAIPLKEGRGVWGRGRGAQQKYQRLTTYTI